MDTSKESQTHRRQKHIQLISIIMLICRVRSEAKGSSHSGDILCKKSNNLIGRENFGAKTQESDC